MNKRSLFQVRALRQHPRSAPSQIVKSIPRSLLVFVIAYFCGACCPVRDPINNCCAAPGFHISGVGTTALPIILRSPLAAGGVVRNESLCTEVCGHYATECEYIPNYCVTRPMAHLCDGSVPQRGAPPYLLMCSPGECGYH